MDAFERIREVAAELVPEADVVQLVQRAQAGSRPKAYIGFEPSGTAHVGWMVCSETIRRLADTGFEVTVLLADWHAQINDKLGGDLEAIRRCGRYMEEAFTALGVPRERVRYVYASELAASPDYWALVVQVLKATTLARMRRAMTIMGRSEDEGDGDMSKFLYPAMQVADIFHLGIDLAYGGLDQRHAHMLARDVAKTLGRSPPAALHTPLVPSLKGSGRMDATDSVEALAAHKMSKSDPSSGIFLHDTGDEVRAKLKAAHCPAKETQGNPVLDLLRLVVWPRLGQLGGAMTVQRPAKFGGPSTYTAWAALQDDFASGALHPLDLKAATADALDRLLEPVREHFRQHPGELAFVQDLKRTR